jgi:uncharacterized protein YjbI with pentapeptide repeats
MRRIREHVAKLREGVEAWNAWRQTNPDLQPNLSGSRLDMMSLRGANLSEVNLDFTNLREEDLGSTLIFPTNLRGATLNHADLFGAELTGVILEEAHLIGADRWANLSREPPECEFQGGRL